MKPSEPNMSEQANTNVSEDVRKVESEARVMVDQVSKVQSAQTVGESPAADTTLSEERVHHPYSPSTLQSIEACPCYKSRPSQHVRTIIGTLAHKATETRRDDDRLDDDDASAVAQCLDFYD